MNFNSKNILLGIGLSVALSSILYFQNENEKENEKESGITPQVAETTKQNQTKSIEILYLEDEKEEIVQNKIEQEAKEEVKTVLNNQTKKLKFSDINLEEEGSIQKYISEKKLIDIDTPQQDYNNKITTDPETAQSSTGNIKRYTTYSKITTSLAQENRDSSIPPPAPIIISGSFHDGTPYSTVISADVLSQSEEVILVDNQSDLAVDLVEEKQNQEEERSDSEVLIVAPPSVGK